MISQWVELVGYILEHPNWCNFKESASRDFWQSILNERSDKLITWYNTHGQFLTTNNHMFKTKQNWPIS